jgi:hypothetical protein
MKSTKYVGAVALLAWSLLATYAQTPAAPFPGAPAEAQAAVSANLSPGAAEVAKLATSGVGDEVVLAYIKNAQAPFSLSADDVLYLKDIGLSPEVTSAMLSHDSTLHDQPPQYAPAAANPASSVAPTPAAPAASAVQPASPPAPTVAAAPAPVYVSSPPPDVTYFYNDLAPYGTWVQLEGYGWCWQPTAVVVNPGWRPYCQGGHWVYSDLGWYWQSTYSWGWAPFHYGRWYLHPRCGWVWLPDRVWGPAWVTWRTAGDTCGWAPLPPHAVFDMHLGWRYKGVAVGASFGFNLGSDAFLFVSFGNFCQPNLYRHCLPPARVHTIYNQTTVINNYVVNNNRIVHRGIPVERVSAAGHVAVPRATVRDWSDRPDRMPARTGSVVYRPHLEAPARPAHMEAQRVDPQHPVIRHSPSGSPRVERSAVSGRGVQAPRTSIRSRDTEPASAPQIQSTPTTPQRALTIPPAATAPRAPENWKQGTRPAPGYRSDAGLPALNNARIAGQSPAATTQKPSEGRNAPAYLPKGHPQAAEIRSVPQSSQRPSARSSTPANNADARSGKSQR